MVRPELAAEPRQEYVDDGYSGHLQDVLRFSG